MCCSVIENCRLNNSSRIMEVFDDSVLGLACIVSFNPRHGARS